ncbi:hypothetical protein [Rossellomorea marisflavi]|uniref:hypothetical protein n=1 Tax=Rossellomorea marisflavi TaxID=189381 RepID=UPI00069D114A|nr:hypothetical protein [Rossellomorea marisflavi]
MLNVLSAKVVAGALSLGILAPAAYTATTQDTADQPQVEVKQQLDEETKSKLDEIKGQVEDGTITRDEAKEKLDDLGIRPPGLGGHHGGPGMELDDETRQKLDDIRDQVKSGDLTEEEAKEKIADLGIEMPQRPDGMDEETHQKTHDIRDRYMAGMITKEEAQKELDELDIDLDLDKMPDPFADLDAATKKKAQAILKKAVEGTITREEAHEQLEDLGVKMKGPRGGGDHGPSGSTKENEQSDGKTDLDASQTSVTL